MAVKFNDVIGNQENLSILVSVKEKKNVFSYNRIVNGNSVSKNFYPVIVFDGTDVNKLTIFDDALAEKLELNKTYTIAGVRSKINR